MARKNTSETYAGRREEDRAQWWVARLIERAAWPLAILFLAVLAAATYLFATDGQAKAIAYLQFLQGPLFTALLGLVVTGLTMIVSKVPQLGRIDRRLGETQKQVEATAKETGVSAERVDTIARFAEQLSAKVDRLDERLDERLDALVGPDRGTVLAEVRAAVEDGFGDILTTARRAVTAQRAAVPPPPPPEPDPEPTGNREPVVYAEPVAQWDPQVTHEPTGPVPPLPPLHPAPGPPTPWTPVPAVPPAGQPVDPLDTRYPWLRDPTGQLPAVGLTGSLLRQPPADEGDDADEEGLPDHIRDAFRTAMDRQQVEDILRRDPQRAEHAEAEQRAYEARRDAARRAWQQYPPDPPTSNEE